MGRKKGENKQPRDQSSKGNEVKESTRQKRKSLTQNAPENKKSKATEPTERNQFLKDDEEPNPELDVFQFEVASSSPKSDSSSPSEHSYDGETTDEESGLVDTLHQKEEEREQLVQEIEDAEAEYESLKQDPEYPEKELRKHWELLDGKRKKLITLLDRIAALSKKIYEVSQKLKSVAH